MNQDGAYTGRFAPSPTGPLHFGSLLAAVASYLEARTRGGRWLLRIEDIDPPREQPGADRLIIDALERYGFEWDGDVLYQAQSAEAHRDALETLVSAGLGYRCGCSRKTLADAPRGPLGIIYPGTCRHGSDAEEWAIRLRTDDEPIRFIDRLQGPVEQRLESESGDFVIRRRDGLIAYHLAVVVDDHLQGISDIVRGIDLMDSTPRQIYVQRCVAYPTPSYGHIPVAVHADGSKLSKLTAARPLPFSGIRQVLADALSALGQEPPADLAASSLADVWQWATDHWRLAVLRDVKAVEIDGQSSADGDDESKGSGVD